MAKQLRWTASDVPFQEGRLAVVTGANSGLGYFTSRALALKGAKVIMACRNHRKAEEARRKILEDKPAMEPEVWPIDLADLISIKEFCKSFSSTHDQLDILVNNAGLMAIPYGKTKDGFEMQFGVNHLGHFALTAQLWPLLKKSDGARIVNVSSLAHHMGRIRFEDIHWEKKYSKWGAYGMSKLSNLLFTKELARKMTESGESVIAAAAHPGYADTNLQTRGAQLRGSKWGERSFILANKLVAQPAEMGALPSIYAATATGVSAGDYYGPGGFMSLKGWPTIDRPNPKRVIEEEARKLWTLSESLTQSVFTI